MSLKFLALVFLFMCQLLALTNGDVEVRISDLEKQVNDLKDDVMELTKTIETLESSVVKRNIADQKLDKAIANVLLNKQDKAAMYWREVVSYLDSSHLNDYLKSLVENAYLGNSENFYYVLEFLTSNELYMGFPMLYKELEQFKELQSGQEVFALASKIKTLCGTSNELYNEMPKVVRDILAGPVILKNIDNNGYILADKDNFPCDDGDAPKTDCYRNSKSQVFIECLPMTTTMDNLKNTSISQWQFVGPDNITELSLGFYIKNMDKDLYFVFGQRPPTALLKGNTTFTPYYSQDYHSQFLPALVPNASADENLIRIGIREKFFRKISYFYGGEFSKKITRLHFSRMPIFQGDVKGFVWEVTPVNGDGIDNAIEGGDTNDKCKFTM